MLRKGEERGLVSYVFKTHTEAIAENSTSCIFDTVSETVLSFAIRRYIRISYSARWQNLTVG